MPSTEAMPWRSETPDEIYARGVECEARDFHADAADLYQEAAIRGHLSAMVALGRHLIGLDDRTSIGWFRAAAERGHPTAWTELGHMYARGYGVERSNPHAVMCWQRGAALGDSAARSCLGLSYIQGFGVEKDPDRGIAIVKEIADSGDIISMRNLAWVYRTGRGVPKNIEQADYWDARAAKTAGSTSGSTQPQLHPSNPKKPQSSSAALSRPITRVQQASTDEGSTQLQNIDSDSVGVDEDAEDAVETAPEAEHPSSSPPVAADASEEEKNDLRGEPTFAPAESAVLGADIPPRASNRELRNVLELASQSQSEQEENVFLKKSSPPSFASTKSLQPGVTYLKLVPISNPKETTYLATEATENDLEDATPVVAVVTNAQDESTPVTSPIVSEPLRVQSSSQPSSESHFRPFPVSATPAAPAPRTLDDRPTASSTAQVSKRTATQLTIPSKGSFWSLNRSRTSSTASGLEIVESALTKIQSSSSKSSLGRSSFNIPHVTVTEIASPSLQQSTESNSPAFPVQQVEERPVVHEDTTITPTDRTIGVEELGSPADSNDKPSTALDFARRTVRRHSTNSVIENEKSPEVLPVPASSSHREPVGKLIAHIEGQEKSKRLGKISSVPLPPPALPPPPPPPIAMAPPPLPAIDPMFGAEPKSSPPPPPPPPAASTSSRSSSIPTPPLPAASESDIVVASVQVEENLLQKIQRCVNNFPVNPALPESRKAVYEFVDAAQNVRADNIIEGQFLVRHRAWDLVLVSMFAQLQDVAIQERGLHAYKRLLRHIPEDAQEAAVLRSCRDSLECTGFASLGLPQSVGHVQPGSFQCVLTAMKMYPVTRLVQMAGCAAIADLAEVSIGARVSVVELGAIPLIYEPLHQRNGSVMSAVYEMACRAVAAICSGPDLVAIKQSMTEHRIIEEVVLGLERWVQSGPDTDDYLLYATRSGCGALKHLCHSCYESSQRAINTNVFECLTKVLDAYRSDNEICTMAIAAIIAITLAASDLAEAKLEECEILTMVLGATMEHSKDAKLVRKALMCLETLGQYKELQGRAVEEGAILVAVDAANTHEDPRVQEQACSTIERLCHYCPTGKDAVATANGMHIIANAMRKYPNDIGVMERAALAASSTCTNHPMNQNSALQLGIASPIVSALGSHGRQSDKLVVACATAITALAQAKDPLMGRKMAREEAPTLLVNSIRSHMESTDVAEHASYALATLCVADAGLAAKLSDQGVESVILAAFKAHLTSSRCVLAILSAIRVMVSKPNKIRTRFMTDQSTGMGLSQLLHMALGHHMDPFPESNMVVLVCGTLNFLAFECVPHKNEIGHSGIFEQLGEMIDVSSRDHNVVGLQPSLAAICTLVLNSKENQDRFMNMNGVEIVLGLMDKWENNAKVLEHCCIALRYSCNQHPGNCEDVKRLHGVKNLNNVMVSHSNNPRLFEMACLALAVLCQGDIEIQESPTVAESIKSTCEAMQAFPEDPVVQVAACTLFLSATFENEANKKRVVRYGGRTAIVKALESHPGHLELAEAGAYALVHVENVSIGEDDPLGQRATEPIKQKEPRSSRLKKATSQKRLSRRKSRDVQRKSSAEAAPDTDVPDAEPVQPLRKSRSRRRNKDKNKGEADAEKDTTNPAGPSRSFLRFGRSRNSRRNSNNQPAPVENQLPDRLDAPSSSFVEEVYPAATIEEDEEHAVVPTDARERTETSEEPEQVYYLE